MSGSSSPAPAPAAAVNSPDKPTANRYDTMFGSDHDSDAESTSHKLTRPAPEIEEDELDDLFGDGSGGEDNGAAAAPAAESDAASPARARTRSPTPERFAEISLPRHPAPAPGAGDEEPDMEDSSGTN